MGFPTIPPRSLPHRRSSKLAAKLTHLSLPIHPFVQLTTGKVHPSFPCQLLNFWLLTTEQLDDLASFYHQRTPCEWTGLYPYPVVWDKTAGIEVKRRRLGRFIGLRGCESPKALGKIGEEGKERKREREREIVREIERKIEREIEKRRRKEEEEELFRKKRRWH